jgi:two-component system, LytTR family, response regulator
LQFAVNKIKLQQTENRINQNQFDYDKLISTINLYQGKKIIINSKTGVESIDLPEVIYLESMSNYTQLHLNAARLILTSKTLKEFDSQLCNSDKNFMRVHNSYIINLHKVARYLKDEEVIIMMNDQKIPLSKSRKDDFFEWLRL